MTFDCAGFSNTLDNALDATRRDGQVVLVAVPWEPMPLEPADWMAREVDLRVSFASLPEDWRIALNLLSTGGIAGESLLTDTSLIPPRWHPGSIRRLDEAVVAAPGRDSALEVEVEAPTLFELVIRVRPLPLRPGE